MAEIAHMRLQNRYVASSLLPIWVRAKATALVVA
jgi:hypothetical protein